MMMYRKLSLLVLTLHFTSSLPLSADWRDQVGWYSLHQWADSVGHSLPDTDHLTVGMAEVSKWINIAAEGEPSHYIETAYIPDQNNGQFSDETIFDATGTATYASGHANYVANYLIGNSYSLTPTVKQLNAYSYSNFRSQMYESREGWEEVAMTHAYIGGASSELPQNPRQVVS